MAASLGGGNAKRRRSAGSTTYVPKKQQKPAAVITIAPPIQKHGYTRIAPARGRPDASQMPKASGFGQQAAGGAKSVDNGGVFTIQRPKYDADMIPVTEHNVWPVLEKLLAATQSMSMLLGSLKDDLQRTSALAAKAADGRATHLGPLNDVSLKRMEAAMKLWRAFDAYQKSFVDIESYSRETGTTAKGGEAVDSSTRSNCVGDASATDKRKTDVGEQSSAGE